MDKNCVAKMRDFYCGCIVVDNISQKINNLLKFFLVLLIMYVWILQLGQPLNDAFPAEFIRSAAMLAYLPDGGN